MTTRYWRKVSAVLLAPLVLWFGLGSATARAQAPAAAETAPKPAPDASSGAGAAPPAQGEPGTDSATQAGELDPEEIYYEEENDPEAQAQALKEFRPTLDQHGYWIKDPKYGMVWVPNRSVVGDGFAPYVTSGHWALADDGGWLWVSDYPFGWITFHYGRWVRVVETGWVWVPGYRYAHAWVSWRVPVGSYAYVGWAPLSPSYVWFDGFAFSVWYGFPHYYVFCPSRHVFSHHVRRHVVHGRARVRAVARATEPDRTPRQRYYQPPSGPRLSDARVPREGVPAQRTRPDSRAAAFAKTMDEFSAPRAGVPGRTIRSTGVRPAPAPGAVRPSERGGAFAPSRVPAVRTPVPSSERRVVVPSKPAQSEPRHTRREAETSPPPKVRRGDRERAAPPDRARHSPGSRSLPGRSAPSTSRVVPAPRTVPKRR